MKKPRLLRRKKLNEELGREDGIQNTTRIPSTVPDEKPIEIDPEELKEKIKNIKALIPWWFIITKFKHRLLDDIFDSMK